MARQTKTPRERAEEALAVADRLYRRLDNKREQLIYQIALLDPEIEAAQKRRDYLAASPDLPQTGMDVPEPPKAGV